MPIVKNRLKNGAAWYSVRCECCGRETLNEQTREDAAGAIRNTGWYVVTTNGISPKDYCPECFRAAMDVLDSERRKKHGGQM
jgi:hypothetical protein